MINFFPSRFPDELLYSVIARYKEQSGISSKKALSQALFASENYRVSTLFTQNIDTLVSNLPPNHLLTAENLIKENTLYPFYTAFVSSQKRDEVLLAMKKADKKSIEARLGIKNWHCNAKPLMKYCPVCYKEDMACKGESYWRRLFQVPGVLICPIHKVKLKESRLWTNNLQLEYQCPNSDVCNDQWEKIDDQLTELNVVFVSNCMKLLKQLYKKKETLFIRDFYIDQLRKKGLASVNGSIYMQDLLHSFKTYYGQEYLVCMNSDYEIDDMSNWLRVFVRSTNKNRSPLRHLLLLQFLEVEVDELFMCNSVQGKIKVSIEHTPILNREEKREKWLRLIEENHGASRSKLKEKAGGLHSWLFRHDREWYESVTPLYKKKPNRVDKIDYNVLDLKYLEVVKKAVADLRNAEGKPVQLTYTSIKRHSKLNIQIKNGKYPLTYAYIKEVEEDIESFRERKIKWAIAELCKEGISLTEYKVQLKAGFGGYSNNNSEIREQIKTILKEVKEHVCVNE